MFSKRTLGAVITARSFMNWTIFEGVNGSWKRLGDTNEREASSKYFYLCNEKGDLKDFQTTTTKTTSTAPVWQINLGSMTVTIILSSKTVDDLSESINHFNWPLMNEI